MPLHHLARNIKPRHIRLAAFAAAAAVLIPAGAASAVAGTPTTTASGRGASDLPHGIPAAPGSHGTKPTIVLVHGAWTDSSSWSGEITRLRQAGYPVQAAPNPLRGLSSDAAYLRDYLSTVTGPIILVGHSYGGAVITNAAYDNKNIKALVYVDAFIPDEGQAVGQLIGPDSALAPAATDPASVLRLVPYPGTPAGIVDTYLLHSVFLRDFAQDLPAILANQLWASQSPASLIALGEASGPAAWKQIPSWDLVGRQDRVIPEARQLAMATHAGAHVVMINASHVSLISHPGAVTALIEKVAGEVS